MSAATHNQSANASQPSPFPSFSPGATFYKMLGVESDASSEAIESAFRKQSRIFHPDKNSKDPDAKEKFQELNNARQTLLDPQKRKDYDNSLRNAPKVTPAPTRNKMPQPTNKPKHDSAIPKKRHQEWMETAHFKNASNINELKKLLKTLRANPFATVFSFSNKPSSDLENESDVSLHTDNLKKFQDFTNKWCEMNPGKAEVQSSENSTIITFKNTSDLCDFLTSASRAGLINEAGFKKINDALAQNPAFSQENDMAGKSSSVPSFTPQAFQQAG
jgi:curved DNA-binding protein CbpA